jgi:hypothetical protein
VAWSKVMCLAELGGLGVLDLMTLGYALCLCWEWLARMELTYLWASILSKCEHVV